MWHGGADTTVIPSNVTEIIKQWTEVHGLPARPSCETVVDGYPRQVWISGAGDEVIESYTIPHMAHGTPLAAGDADHQCGVAGPFLLEVGISSSYHIAKFFGLTAVRSAREMMRKEIRTFGPDVQDESENMAAQPSKPLEGEVLEPNFQSPLNHPSVDIGAVITKALKAAGLMKGS